MFESIDLNIVWFILVGTLFSGYAILDGFDLGTGVVNLFLRNNHHRRVTLNAVGPVWDGNEVWLVTGGGALFAAFPPVYACVFSGFYLAFMLLLLALIARAVSIEFRGKQPMRWWRSAWDATFSASSILASLLIGIALGNIIWGIPIDGDGNYTGTFTGLLHPYALLLGVTTLALFTMHGCIFLVLKTEGELQNKLRRIAKYAMCAFAVLVIVHAIATIALIPHATATLNQYPWLYSIAGLVALSILAIIYFLNRQREFWAFMASCSTMACMMMLFGLAMYPVMVYSNPDPGNSITIYTGAATPYSLSIMTVIAIIGVPLVLTYSAAIYWVFRGKVKLDDSSY